MRILIDNYDMDWEKAWRITTNTFAYTNHTLLPEALEKWSVSLFKSLLPRLLEIIYEINKRFLEEVNEKYPNDTQKQQALSIIEEGEDKSIRMAYLGYNRKSFNKRCCKTSFETIKRKPASSIL